MAKLNVLHYPDDRLHIKAAAIIKIEMHHHQLADDMFETMYAEGGIGLAATQVNVHEQLIVIDLQDGVHKPLVLINPTILQREGEQEIQEGCLSVPGIYDKIIRAHKVQVSYLDLSGQNQTLWAEDLFAVCIQHEIDHLQGKVFVEYLSRFKQDRIQHKLQKQLLRER
jgi:peptide deformylase